MCIFVVFSFLVNLISMLVSFSICGFIYGLLVPNWIWDYAVTVTLIHITMCCIGKHISHKNNLLTFTLIPFNRDRIFFCIISEYFSNLCGMY